MQHISTYCRAKHGLEAIKYPHPDLAEVLDETYGVIVYQDQVLHIARKFAGYSRLHSLQLAGLVHEFPMQRAGVDRAAVVAIDGLRFE